MALRHQVNINFILSRLDNEIERLNQTCNSILDLVNQQVDNVDDKVTLLNVCLVEMANSVGEFMSTWHKYTSMYEEAVDKDRDDFGLLQKISADQQRQAQQLNELIDVVNSLFVGDAENEGDEANGGIIGFMNKLVESNNKNFAKIDLSLRQINQLGPRIDACVGQIALKEYLQSDQYKNNRLGNKSALKNLDNDLIVKLYKEGQSVGQIAKTFGVSGPTISSRLKEMGVWHDRRCKDD